MSDHFKQIYQSQADNYERLVSREDYHGNLFGALNEIHPLDQTSIVDIGTGTGRLTRLLSVIARQIVAFDLAPEMLQIAHQNMIESGMENWSFAQADNRFLPLPASIVDIAIEGWSFGHTVGWHPDQWPSYIGQMIHEMDRVLKPGGTAILLETLGTGNRKPQPPTPGLAELYQWLETEQGFSFQWIRTDYQFANLDEAENLVRFFFGDELAERVRTESLIVLPECTGIWSRQKQV
ncbi:hypothetical protein MASR2M15_15200 [Anaerolineales bacterium]